MPQFLDDFIDYVIHADCFDILPSIPDKSIDMILADLPYGKLDVKWDEPLPYKRLWEQYNRIIKPNCAIVLTAVQPFTSFMIMNNLKYFKYVLCWHKRTTGDFANAKNRPMRTHEDVIVFSHGKSKYNPQMVKRTDKELSRFSYNPKATSPPTHIKGIASGRSPARYTRQEKYPTSVIDIMGIINHSKEKFPHPTQKPVALFEYLIKTYSNEGDIILDNVCGTGTTGIACINTNRRFILIEKEEGYYHMTFNRIEEKLSEH